MYRIVYLKNRVGRLVDFASLDDTLGLGLPKTRCFFSDSDSVYKSKS